MRTLMICGSLLLAATPAMASTYGNDWFHDAKSGYRVDVSYSGPTMLLDGYKSNPHSRFHLEVSPRGVVTGVYEGRPVKYVLGDTAHTDLVAVNSPR